MANTSLRIGYLPVVSGGGGGTGSGGYEEYSSLSTFPPIGVTEVIYLALNTNKIYRWNGADYVEISSAPVTSVNSKIGSVVIDKSDVGLNNVDNTSDLNKPISTATQTALTNINNAIAKKIILFAIGDWTLSGDEYLLTVAAAIHEKGVNPEVIVLENTGTEFAEVLLYKAINASGDLLLAVSAIPDNRFAGKIIIS
jgi:hypothetical protein